MYQVTISRVHEHGEQVAAEAWFASARAAETYALIEVVRRSAEHRLYRWRVFAPGAEFDADPIAESPAPPIAAVRAAAACALVRRADLGDHGALFALGMLARAR